ncbi:DNA-binding MarR family transcriptional regulator [Arthrobacter pascens]|nr:DNA-binding MarR family transcriptional regulator [Arthrobacter pascens]
MQLWDGGGQSQKALGETQKIDHSTITKSVRRLESARLVRRKKSDADRRVTLVFLTDAGRALRSPVLAIWAALEERTRGGLTTQEAEQFIALADKILLDLESPSGERRESDLEGSCRSLCGDGTGLFIVGVPMV